MNTSLKSQVVYSKQPKLGLTQEFVVDCAHALWVVRSIKRLVLSHLINASGDIWHMTSDKCRIMNTFNIALMSSQS